MTNTLRTWEMDIFEYMDTVIDKFFTDLDNTIVYEEPEEAPQDEDFEEDFEEDFDEEDFEEEPDEDNPYSLTEAEEIAYNKYDDERGAWDL